MRVASSGRKNSKTSTVLLSPPPAAAQHGRSDFDWKRWQYTATPLFTWAHGQTQATQREFANADDGLDCPCEVKLLVQGRTLRTFKLVKNYRKRFEDGKKLIPFFLSLA